MNPPLPLRNKAYRPHHVGAFAVAATQSGHVSLDDATLAFAWLAASPAHQPKAPAQDRYLHHRNKI
ncbi:hypothetical protein, partial [Rhodovulum sulfidophilum]|uniref:hypothetical protein n=1 Tax=Rhodovulum sulfidophilum TaxID=35806 RepID=UPI001F3017A0